ncbi:hypothetical protein GCM10027569_05030 [Flindersiella endophytica]
MTDRRPPARRAADCCSADRRAALGAASAVDCRAVDRRTSDCCATDRRTADRRVGDRDAVPGFAVAVDHRAVGQGIAGEWLQRGCHLAGGWRRFGFVWRCSVGRVG